MPLTPEQFQKARSAGFSTEQIVGFEKKRESVPADRSQFETPEFQGGAQAPANLKAQEDVQKAQVATEALDPAIVPLAAMNQYAGGIPQMLTGGRFPEATGADARFASDAGGLAGAAASPVYPAVLKVAGFGLGKLAGKAGQVVTKATAPFKESKVIEAQLNDLKGEVGLPKEATTGYIGKELTHKAADLAVDKKEQLANVKNYVNSKVDEIKAQRDQFDKTILQSKATDFAKYMKENGVDWAKKGSQKYGEVIDKISSMVPETVPITTEDTAMFLKDIAATAEAQGINSPMLGYIKQLVDKYDNMAIASVGSSHGAPVNFGTLKAELSGVNKYLSSGFKSGKYIEGGDRLAAISKGKWLDFMGKYIPEEGIEDYRKLQANYKQFADAKRQIGNMFHPYSGEFDLTAGINSAKKIALDKVNEGNQNLMEVLDKGIPGLVPGIENFSGKAKGLTEAGQQRKVLEMFPGLLKQSGKLSENKIAEGVAEKAREITAWRRKYDELTEIQKRNQEAKDKIMNVLSIGTRPLIKAGKKFVGL